MGDAGGVVAAVLGVIIVLICAGIALYFLWKKRGNRNRLCCDFCVEKERVVSTPRAKTTNSKVTTGLVAVKSKHPQPVENMTIHNEVAMELYSVSTNIEPPAYSETMQENVRRFTPQCRVRQQYRRESLCSKTSEGSRISTNSHQLSESDTSHVRRMKDNRSKRPKTNKLNQNKRHTTVNKLPSYRLPSVKSKTMPKHFFQAAKSQGPNNQLARRHSDLPSTLSTKHCSGVSCIRTNSSVSHKGFETRSKLLKHKLAHRRNKADSTALRHINTHEDLNFVGIENEVYVDDENESSTTGRSQLTRSGTILELPIYCQQKNKRRTSSRTKNRVPSASSKYENVINSNKNSERRKRRKRRPTRKSLDKPNKSWTSGYGSLPADLSKIPQHVVDDFGMDPIESLNFEKLCRPIPDFSKASTLSPRKSVLEKIGSHVNNKEREILANTYEYEDLGLVSTDL